MSLFNVLAVFLTLRQVFQSDDPIYQMDPDGDLILSSISPIALLTVSVIGFVCAVNILEGANWARWLYMVVCVCLVIYELLAYTHYSIAVYVGMISRAAMIVVLFLPDSNEFFKQES